MQCNETRVRANPETDGTDSQADKAQRPQRGRTGRPAARRCRGLCLGSGLNRMNVEVDLVALPFVQVEVAHRALVARHPHGDLVQAGIGRPRDTYQHIGRQLVVDRDMRHFRARRTNDLELNTRHAVPDFLDLASGSVDRRHVRFGRVVGQLEARCSLV